MGLITPNDFPNLRELYTGQLRYLLSAENQIVDGLPKMIEHAQGTQLKQAFQSHLQETRTVFRAVFSTGRSCGDSGNQVGRI